tara:strand:+ start:536 stop:1276 length:741 start_codon:yes stop_codon:yes gene_type:complete
MKNNYYNLKSFKNIYSEPSEKSEVISQIIYGESFKIISKKKDWIKIKTNFDNYIGFIQKGKIFKNFNPTHKIFKKNSQIYKMHKGKLIKSKNFLSFASKLSVIRKNKNFVEFEPNRWVKKVEIKGIKHKFKNFKKIFNYFLNSKYKWGGKHFSGIDCSGLVQIFFYYNETFCPRDTIDQILFFKKMKKDIFRIKKKLIFWKGHVAICMNKKTLIHAYGPRKKVVIMNINKTLVKIFKDTNLKPIYI